MRGGLSAHGVDRHGHGTAGRDRTPRRRAADPARGGGRRTSGGGERAAGAAGRQGARLPSLVQARRGLHVLRQPRTRSGRPGPWNTCSSDASRSSRSHATSTPRSTTRPVDGGPPTRQPLFVLLGVLPGTGQCTAAAVSQMLHTCLGDVLAGDGRVWRTTAPAVCEAVVGAADECVHHNPFPVPLHISDLLEDPECEDQMRLFTAEGGLLHAANLAPRSCREVDRGRRRPRPLSGRFPGRRPVTLACFLWAYSKG